ncbi:YciC family protein [Parendozoicomonas sp. Alg238-R29]|uniref:YciC family protein n=1 Tax=Parendozoicomonas sp. Alg238-R29 TaxID=2993446 RepID=UPI00248E5E5F|nr:YciC family protein [Parendozoicomonas sp. Alg238-R29]
MQTTPQQVQIYLRDTLTFFRSHISTLAVIILPYALLSELVHRLVIKSLTEADQLYAGLMTELALYPIVHSVLILFIAAVIGGQQRSIGECYRYSVPFWPRMLLLTLLSTLAIMAGLSLFILPGIIVMIRLALSDMYCMLEGTSVTESIRRSFITSSSVTWVIFLGLAILFPTVTMFSIALAQFSAGMDNPAISVVVTSFQALLQTLYPIYLFRVYSAAQNAS